MHRDNDIICHGSHTPTKLHIEVHATQVNTPISTFRFHFTRDIAQGQAEHRRITAFVHTVTGPAKFIANGAPFCIAGAITVHFPGFVFNRNSEIERLQRHTRLLLGLGCGLAVCLLRLGVDVVVLLWLAIPLLRLGVAVVVLLWLTVTLLRLGVTVVVLLRLTVTLLRLGIAVVILRLAVTLLRLGIAIVILLLTICRLRLSIAVVVLLRLAVTLLRLGIFGIAIILCKSGKYQGQNRRKHHFLLHIHSCEPN